MAPTDVDDLLDAVAKVLGRCFVLGFLFLFLWAGAYLLGGDLIYRQGNMFHLAPHEIDLILSWLGVQVEFFKPVL